ncbi:helix-turn-helix domain-containing protein [Nocardioides caeni]|uniref:Helix-turn-helix transcriptional regulator n=1 Tax=Nocardioides caeni TaxID=574700 RepID=A0A4S8N0B1_9ACTN|nr:AraC family transcriptional regulator [Nocardioides caeni]THV08881.1 helix-turn-helix transcriptional regulator [Nocardioides caeni]
MPTEPLHDSPLEELVDHGVATVVGTARRVATNHLDIGATQAAGQLWPAHSHAEHELLWGVTGGLTVSTPTGSHVVPRGLALWIPSGTLHEVHASAGAALSCTWFAADLTAGPAAASGTTTSIVVSRLLAETLRHLDDPALDDERRGRAEAFAGDLVTGHTRHLPTFPLSLPLPHSPDLRALADAILDDPSDTSTVGDLAVANGLSPRTLTRRFQAETGMPLAQWRTRARIGAATRALALGVPPTRVARQTGFATPSAFGATFRRLTGVSPRAYAAIVRPRAELSAWPDRDIS